MEYLVKPWAHQLKAIERASGLRDYALLMEMGTGKTMTLINILRHKFNAEKRVLRTLVLCPPIVIKNWREEWLRHSKIDPSLVTCLTGSAVERAKRILNRGYDLDMEKRGAVFITNYEALIMKDFMKVLHEWGPEVLVYDESHKCKDMKSQRTKAASKLSSTAKHRYILSGTPVLNSPLDIFSQYLILDNGDTFGRNFFAFRGLYFRDKNAGMPKDRYFPKFEIMPGALEAINSKMFSKATAVKKSECMDLPPLVQQTIRVPMLPEQKTLYDTVKKDFIGLYKEETVLSTLAITKALRLQQIASGYAKTVEGNELSMEKTPKQEALKELLSTLTPNHKVLVWAVWKENYEQIRRVCTELGLPFVEVHGDVAQAAKFQNVDSFRDNPNIRVLIGHPGSGGIGINLVAADYSIFFSRNFSLEQSLQAEARNHRGGSEIHQKITRIDLVCEDTIDEHIQKILANKLEVSEKVLRDLSLVI